MLGAPKKMGSILLPEGIDWNGVTAGGGSVWLASLHLIVKADQAPSLESYFIMTRMRATKSWWWILFVIYVVNGI